MILFYGMLSWFVKYFSLIIIGWIFFVWIIIKGYRYWLYMNRNFRIVVVVIIGLESGRIM